MAVADLPYWTILPNWREPVIERLEALTSVLRSPSGAEQRFGARWTPRRSFEALTTVTGRNRMLFDNAVGAVGGNPWWLPVWPDSQSLAVPVTIGDTSIVCVTTGREFRAGGFAMLWSGEFDAEVVEVTSVAPGVLNLAAPLAASRPAGTRLFPAVQARLTDMPDMKRVGSRAIENSIRFESIGDNEIDGLVLPFPTYLDLPVFTTRPDEGQALTHGYSRLFDEIDGETGLKRRFDTADIGFTLQQFQWLTVGRVQLAALRSLFYQLDGQRELLWLPSFADDFDLVAPIDAADTAIEVVRNGFTDYGGPRVGHEDVMIALRDGTLIFRRITGSSLTGENTETIVFDEAIGVDATIKEVRQVCFLAQSRLDADVLELTHHSDIDGACRSSIVFRSAPEIREGSDWFPDLPPDMMMNDQPCGTIDCVPEILMAEGGPSQVTVSDPSGGGNLAFINLTDGLDGTVVVYTNGTSPTIRFREVISGVAGSEIDTEIGPPDVTGITMNEIIPLGLSIVSPTINVAISSGGLHEIDLYTGALNATHDIAPAGHTILSLDALYPAYRVAMIEPGVGLSFQTWSFGDPLPVTPILALAGDFDMADSSSIGGFGNRLIVGHDAATGRLHGVSVSFFTGEVFGSDLISNGSSTNERFICAEFSQIDSRLNVTWRKFTGSGPGGSVMTRKMTTDFGDQGAEVVVYNLTALGVSGYTHLANREPVCGVPLPNGNVLMVERRYETVGAQLRAYEVLVLHAPGEPSKQSNIIRLTPSNVGPTGDVKRSARIRQTGSGAFGGDFVVVYESPVNDTGGTELLLWPFTATTCTETSEPE